LIRFPQQTLEQMKKIIFHLLILSSVHLVNAQSSGFGVPHHLANPEKCLSDSDREHIRKVLHQNGADLKRVQGEITFEWPLRQAANFDEWGPVGISNYVDLNKQYPDQLLDYNCGDRTYDTQAGYNHQGTDIFSWPFPWYKLDNNQMEVIAAAAGTIIYKQQSNYDKSCAFNSNPWNAVYIQHADGSVAWYGHLKKNSLTSKEQGDAVEVGEFLGVMGSSGNSTGPHLHFEVYNADGKLIDPFYGSCNNTTDRSWWANQEDYYLPGINNLYVHSEVPSFGCYNDEKFNIAINLEQGHVAYFSTYFRDQMSDDPSYHRLIDPSGSTYTEWQTSSSQYYAGSYWWRSFTMPTGDNYSGKWTFEVTYHDVTRSRNFYLYDSAPDEQMALSVDTLYFDITPAGEMSTASFTIKNTGNDGVLISKMTCPEPFRSNWYGGINNNEEKVIEVAFMPESTDAYTGKLELETTASGTKELILVGKTNEHIDRVLELAESLDFGEVEVGKSLELEVDVVNSGNFDIQVTNVEYPVAYDGETQFAIEAGGTYKLTVSFTPPNNMVYEGEMIFESNATSGRNTMSISGKGFLTLGLDVQPSMLYPNPSFDKMVNLSNSQQVKSIQVYNLSGMKVFEQSHPGDVIDLGGIQSGLYLVEIKGTQKSQKLRLILR